MLRKYWKTAALAATAFVGDSPLFLMDYLLRFLRVAVLLSIWRSILTGRGTTAGMTIGSVLTYTLIAEMFGEQLACRTGLDEAIWEGSIGARFLRPMGTVGQFAAETFGHWWFSFFAFSIPLLLCSPLLGVNPLPASAAAAGWFVPSLALAISIGLALEFIFAALMIWIEIGIWVMEGLRIAISTLLSGALLPLALLPWGIGAVFGWLPFASMASAPLRIYTGTGSPVLLIAIQATWSILLWRLAHALWAANRERLVGYGG